MNSEKQSMQCRAFALRLTTCVKVSQNSQDMSPFVREVCTSKQHRLRCYFNRRRPLRPKSARRRPKLHDSQPESEVARYPWSRKKRCSSVEKRLVIPHGKSALMHRRGYQAEKMNENIQCDVEKCPRKLCQRKAVRFGERQERCPPDHYPTRYLRSTRHAVQDSFPSITSEAGADIIIIVFVPYHACDPGKVWSGTCCVLACVVRPLPCHLPDT